jgi:hypothetical protein
MVLAGASMRAGTGLTQIAEQPRAPQRFRFKGANLRSITKRTR